MNFKWFFLTLSFCTTICFGQKVETLKDSDGNTYKTVTIGKQLWTAENWRCTKYADGTAIPEVRDSAIQWSLLSTPGFSWGDIDAMEHKKWGAFYNWYVINPANPKKIAPNGWRVPTDADWTALENYLIANGYNWDKTTTGNKIAKALAAETDWFTTSTTYKGEITNNMTTNNSTGFSALPSGFITKSGVCTSHKTAIWWSTTEDAASTAWRRLFNFDSESLQRSSENKKAGYSLRLVRDL